MDSARPDAFSILWGSQQIRSSCGSVSFPTACLLHLLFCTYSCKDTSPSFCYYYYL